MNKINMSLAEYCKSLGINTEYINEVSKDSTDIPRKIGHDSIEKDTISYLEHDENCSLKIVSKHLLSE